MGGRANICGTETFVCVGIGWFEGWYLADYRVHYFYVNVLCVQLQLQLQLQFNHL